MIRDDELVPADLLIISTSEKRGLCYVETKNLDGETNLKVKSCVQGLNKFKTPQECSQLNGKLETEKPTPHMYTLNGKGHVQSSDGIGM